VSQTRKKIVGKKVLNPYANGGKKDPVPQAVAALVGALAESLVDWLGGKIRRGADWATWHGYKTVVGTNVIDDYYQTFISAEPDPITGVTPAGLSNITVKGIDTITSLSIVIDPDLIEEMFTEMIQEMFSNALQYSVGGAVQTITGTYRGGYPYTPDEYREIAEQIDAFDDKLHAFYLASSGANIPRAMGDIVYGANRWLDDYVRDVHTVSLEYYREHNDNALTYHRLAVHLARLHLQHAVMAYEALIDRINRIRERICEHHLARINELRDSLEGLRAWYDAGLISEEEFKIESLKIKYEAEASKQVYDEFMQKLDEIAQQFVDVWNQLVEDACTKLNTAVSAFADALQPLAEQTSQHLVSRIDEIDELINAVMAGVRAYRSAENVVGGGGGYTPPTPTPKYSLTVEVEKVG